MLAGIFDGMSAILFFPNLCRFEDETRLGEWLPPGAIAKR